MAATNFTPISLYYTTTAAATPSAGNLVAGELALNTLDEKLYFKNSAGTVKLLASNSASSGTVSSVAATVPAFLSIAGSPITTSGTLAITYSGTALPVANGGTGLTSGTSGGVLAYTASGTLASSGALTQYGVVIGGGAGAAPTSTAAGTAGYVLTANSSAAPTFQAIPSVSQVYPGAGIAVSTGTAWTTSKATPTGVIVGDTDTQTLTNKTLTNPTITNYTETPFSANSSTAITLALTNGTVQIITLTGNATITMPTAVSGKSFTILLKQDATGSRTVTWTTVSWPSATAPTITSTASKMDKYVFISDGTSWFGATSGQNYT